MEKWKLVGWWVLSKPVFTKRPDLVLADLFPAICLLYGLVLVRLIALTRVMSAIRPPMVHIAPVIKRYTSVQIAAKRAQLTPAVSAPLDSKAWPVLPEEMFSICAQATFLSGLRWWEVWVGYCTDLVQVHWYKSIGQILISRLKTVIEMPSSSFPHCDSKSIHFANIWLLPSY